MKRIDNTSIQKCVLILSGYLSEILWHNKTSNYHWFVRKCSTLYKSIHMTFFPLVAGTMFLARRPDQRKTKKIWVQTCFSAQNKTMCSRIKIFYIRRKLFIQKMMQNHTCSCSMMANKHSCKSRNLLSKNGEALCEISLSLKGSFILLWGCFVVFFFLCS